MEFMNGRQRNPARIKPMLEKLKEAWQLYPDMRLGQLIAICAAYDNIFGIEDGVMYERLQEYIDSMSNSERR